MNEFKKECLEWLEPLGYGINAVSGDGTTVMLANYESLGENYPHINCYNKGYEKTVKLIGTDFKLFLTMVSGELAFKHEDIEKYINVMKHYADVCEAHPPF